MGQGNSAEGAKLQSAVQKLTKLELKDLERVFQELSEASDSGQSVIKQPTWLNRDKFAEIFGTNELVVEQLFDIFDRDRNGIVDMQEFVTGMALCLHGSIRDKCQLLFKIFNLDGDEGVSPEELSTILTSCLQSAHSLLVQTLKLEGLSFSEDGTSSGTSQSEALMVSVVVNKIVTDAFNKCDTSRNGKLEIDEFARWVHKHPKLMNNLFVLQCPKPSQIKSSKSSGGDSITHSESLYSVIQTPTEEIDVFFDVSQQLPQSQQSSAENNEASMESKQTTLQDLFSTPAETSGQESFFDSLGASQDTADGDTSLSRPASEQFLSSNLAESKDILGGSENHIESFGKNTTILPKHMQHITGSDSLHSITLSQDSLSEGKDSSGEYVTKKQEIDETSILSAKTKEDIVDNNKIWHPLRKESQSEEDAMQEQLENQAESIAISNEIWTNDLNIKEEEIAIANASLVSEPSYEIGYEVGVEPTMEEIEVTVEDKEKKGHSYWPPSYKTENLINDFRLGHHIDERKLTYPSVLIEGLMGDPAKELVAKYLGEQEASKRPFPTADSVELNENGLKLLLTHGCWRGAIDFTSNYLANYGLGLNQNQNYNQKRTMLTPTLIQIWFVRIALLVKLRMFSQAEAELNAFNNLDGPDLYYQFYPHLYHGKKGSMVPFSFRLLFAELPQHNGRPNLALDRLYSLQKTVSTIRENLSKGFQEDGSKNDIYNEEEIKELNQLWSARYLRVQYALGNCFLGMKEYNLAVRLFKSIIKLEPQRKLSILSAIGRIYLQVGDILTATMYFKDADNVKSEDPRRDSILSMNKGYLNLAESNYNDAYQFFTAAATQDKENLAAVNNAAVCLLFLGKVKEASNLLERMVWEYPQQSLHQDVLFNLNTIYELETSRALQKKHKLLDLVSKHKGDGFFTQCLKLT